MPKRLNFVKDNDPLFPVQAFFNAISDDSFVRTVENLSKNIGAAFDDCDCEFPGDLDPGDETFEGVRFSLFEEEVVVDQNTFQRFLRLACEEHLRRHPQDSHAINESLSSIVYTQDSIRGHPG